MSDLNTVFRGSGTAVSSTFRTAGGNYLFAVMGTHASGTTQLEHRIPGTTPTEYSAWTSFDSATQLTADGTPGVTLARGREYRVSSIPGTVATRVVFVAIQSCGIGNT